MLSASKFELLEESELRGLDEPKTRSRAIIIIIIVTIIVAVLVEAIVVVGVVGQPAKQSVLSLVARR